MTPDRPDRQAPPREPAQPDPMLNEGRASTLKISLIMILATLVVVIVLYGLTRDQDRTADVTPPAETPAPSVATSPNPGVPGASKNTPATTGQGTPKPQQDAQPPANSSAPTKR